MKHLLSILSSLMIVGTIATPVISCTNSNPNYSVKLPNDFSNSFNYQTQNNDKIDYGTDILGQLISKYYGNQNPEMTENVDYESKFETASFTKVYDITFNQQRLSPTLTEIVNDKKQGFSFITIADNDEVNSQMLDELKNNSDVKTLSVENINKQKFTIYSLSKNIQTIKEFFGKDKISTMPDDLQQYSFEYHQPEIYNAVFHPFTKSLIVYFSKTVIIQGKLNGAIKNTLTNEEIDLTNNSYHNFGNYLVIENTDFPSGNYQLNLAGIKQKTFIIQKYEQNTKPNVEVFRTKDNKHFYAQCNGFGDGAYYFNSSFVNYYSTSFSQWDGNSKITSIVVSNNWMEISLDGKTTENISGQITIYGMEFYLLLTVK